MNKIFCGIIFSLASLPLPGMDKSNPIKQPNSLKTIPSFNQKPIVSSEEMIMLELLKNKFYNGIGQYSQGNNFLGKFLLEDAFKNAEECDLLHLIDPETKRDSFSILSMEYFNDGNYFKSIEYAKRSEDALKAPTYHISSSYEKKYRDDIADSFREAIQAYYFQKNPDLIVAEYEKTRFHARIKLLNPETIRTFYSCLSQIYHDKKEYDMSLVFAQKGNFSDTEKGIIYRHKARQAYEDKDFELERKCYGEAFKLFEKAIQENPGNEQAQKYYENALFNCLGCNYEPFIIKKYCLKQLTSKKKFKFPSVALRELEKLSETDIGMLCTLAKIYGGGECGIKISYERSLFFCEKAIASFIELFNQNHPDEFSELSLTLENLCNSQAEPAIKEKVRVLKLYFDVLFALKNENQKQIQEFCSQSYDSPLESAIVNLMCSNITESTIECIRTLTFDDKDFIDFCGTQGSLVLKTFETLFPNTTENPEITDLVHLLAGGYEYYNKNLDVAFSHFAQYSNYQKDLYLHVINLQASNIAQTKKIQSIVPILKSTLKKENKTHREIRAIGTITQLCRYDSSRPAEEILETCQEKLRLFAISKISPQSSDYLQLLLGLHDLCKKEISADIQKKAIILEIYCNFFELLHANDQDKLNVLLAAPATKTISFRPTFLKAIIGNKKDFIKNIIFENQSFIDFYESDGFIIESLLEQILINPIAMVKIKPHQCHYMLGGCTLRRDDFSKAKDHFLQCLEYKNDLYTQVKLLQSSTLDELIEKMPLLLRIPTDTSSQRDNRAKELLSAICNVKYPAYATTLLDKGDYESVYKLIDYLAAFRLPHTYQTLCNVFVKSEEKLIAESKATYSRFMMSYYRQKTKTFFYKMAQEKNHLSCFCNTIAFVQYEHLKCDHTNENNLDLGIDCLKYLYCSLAHLIADNPTQEIIEQRKIKQDKYAQIAYDLAKYYVSNNNRDKAIEHFDLAIAYNHTKARYAKSFLFPINEETLPTIQEHAASDEPDKVLSLVRLGEYYSELPEAKNQKLAFKFLEQAAALGNYELGLNLGYYYADGIKDETGEWFHTPDLEKAIHCFTKVIEREDKKYAGALYIRALSYYALDKYEEALADLNIFAGLKISTEQKAIGMWLSGIIAMHTDLGLSTELLNSAYNRVPINSNVFDEFRLSNYAKELSKAKEIISSIISHDKTDSTSLYFCSIIGKVLHIQNIHQPITNENRIFAIKSLEYAAKNGHVDAQCTLTTTKDGEVNLYDKIYYSERTLQRDPDFFQTIQPVLDEIYPITIYQQVELIIYLAKKDSALAQQYILKTYSSKSPIVIDPLFYSSLPLEKSKELIRQLLSITWITQEADAFINNPNEKNICGHLCALICGSLLAYSQEQKELLKGASYLDTCRKQNPLFQKEHTTKNLGYIYYKLGDKNSQAESLSKAIGIAYLQRSADCGNIKAMISLSRAWLDDMQETRNINPEYIHTLLLNLNKTQRTTQSQKLLEHYYRKTMPNGQSLSAKNINFKANNATQMAEVFHLQKKHFTYPLLVQLIEEKTSEELIKIIPLLHDTKHGEKAIQMTQLIADSQSDPCACLHIALYHCSKNSNETKKYACKAIKNGTAELSNMPHATFKNGALLNLLCQLMVIVIDNYKSAQKVIFLGEIKAALILQNVNLACFEQFFQAFYSKDLSKCREWQNKKKNK